MGERNRIYLAGSFHDWRDKIIKALPEYDFADPRNNRQNAIAKLVEDDIKNASECLITFAYFPKGKSRPTMTYAEMGAARANGNYIIYVDENEEKDSLIEKVASVNFSKLNDATAYLKKQEPSFELIKISERLKERDQINIALFGNIPRNISNLSLEKKNLIVYDVDDLDNLKNFGEDIDLTVINFDKGLREKHAVFYMGISYALDIPIILSTGNPIVYPPLAGLARRIFTGEFRAEILEDYLTNLSSLEISEEAKVMYGLFEKYRS